jgi:hypothetical protein
MKKNKVEKKAGIWLNMTEAYILDFENPDSLGKIKSGISSRTREPGEEKPYAQFETTYGNAESHKQARNAQFKKQYFKKLVELVHEADYIYIAGPGKTKNELKNAIEKEPFLSGKITGVETTEELTSNQATAFLKEYFQSGKFKIKEGV